MSRKYVWEPLYPIAKRDPEEAIRQLDLRMTRLFRDLSRSIQRQHLQFRAEDLPASASGELKFAATGGGSSSYRLLSSCFAIGVRCRNNSIDSGDLDIIPTINNAQQTAYKMSLSSSVPSAEILIPYRDLFIAKDAFIGFDFETNGSFAPNTTNVNATWFLAFTGED